MYRETAEVVRGLQDQLRKQRVYGSPEYEEGPQSAIKEEEFFDAVETALDRQEKDLDDAKLEGLSNAIVSMKPQLSVLSPAQADDIWEDIEQVRPPPPLSCRIGNEVAFFSDYLSVLSFDIDHE